MYVLLVEFILTNLDSLNCNLGLLSLLYQNMAMNIVVFLLALNCHRCRAPQRGGSLTNFISNVDPIKKCTTPTGRI